MATKTTIKWGETLTIRGVAKDENGDSIEMDGTWSAVCRITSDKLRGTVIENPTMTISGGVATGEVDTRGAAWSPGTYYYDIRLTDASGNDHWSDARILELETRNSPKSTS